MIHAYAEEYLDDAMLNLGEAFDYAANACQIGIDDFMLLFIATGYADCFGKGNPKYVSGLSGTELAMEVLSKAGKDVSFPEPQKEYEASPEYWSGWAVAYYQWKRARTFKDIQSNIPISKIRSLYHPLHEASEDRFADAMDSLMKKKRNPTRLQRKRKECGYSQKELSDRSGVNLRTLQQYESRAKDIDKASAGAVVSLASVMGCKVEDLLEPEAADSN